MFEVLVQQIPNVGRIHVALDLGCRTLDRSRGFRTDFCRRWRGLQFRKHLGARIAARLDEKFMFLRSRTSSVSARSNPRSTCGPVFIEVQKQVEAACVQLTATMKMLSRRLGINRIPVAIALQNPVLNGDGGKLARPNSQKSSAWRRRWVVQNAQSPALLFSS